MKESDFWSRVVRPALNRPPTAVAKKVQDAYNRGMPDVRYCVGGRSGWLELKYIKERPKRPTTPLHINLSVEQARQLSEWHGAGDRAHVLVGVEKTWYLLRHDVPQRVPEQDLGPWVIEAGTMKQIDRLYEYLNRETVS